jgi:hypothetical protein
MEVISWLMLIMLCIVFGAIFVAIICIFFGFKGQL